MQGGGGLAAQWQAPAPDPDRVGFALYAAAADETGCGSSGLADHGFELPQGKGLCGPPGISIIDPRSEVVQVLDPAATSFSPTSLTPERQAAVVVSMDGSGNLGPPSTPACAIVTGAAASGGAKEPKTVTAACGCTTHGSPSRSAGAASALFALALLGARRRVARRV